MGLARLLCTWKRDRFFGQRFCRIEPFRFKYEATKGILTAFPDGEHAAGGFSVVHPYWQIDLRFELGEEHGGSYQSAQMNWLAHFERPFTLYSDPSPVARNGRVVGRLS